MAYAQPVPVSDFAGYKLLAEMLLDQRQFGYPEPSAYRLPGYPFFLAVMMLVSRSLAWLELVNVLLSTALVVLVYFLAKNVTANKAVALISALLVALNPTFVFFAPILASEHLFGILFYSGCLILLTRQFQAPWREILAGFLFGLSVLTRGEGWFYLPVMFIILVAYAPGKRFPIRRFLVFGAASLSVVFPWFLRNYWVIGPGAGLSTSGGVMFYYAHHDRQQEWESLQSQVFEGLDAIERSRRGYQLGFEYIRQAGLKENAVGVAISTAKLYAPHGYPVLWSVYLPRQTPAAPFPEKPLAGKDVFIFLTQFGFGFIAFNALLALAWLGSYPWKMWSILLGFIGMNWLGYGVLFAGTSRYRFGVEPVMCVMAGIGLWELRQWTRRNTS